MNTAKNMAKRYQNARDGYEQNILEAAQWLIEQDKGHFKYSTQWASGNSQWYDPNTDEVITVKTKANK